MTLSAQLDDLFDDSTPATADGRADTTSPKTTERLHRLFDVLWEHQLDVHPEAATYFGEPGPTHRWTDESLEGVDRRKLDDEAALAALRRFEPHRADLDEVDATSLDLAIYETKQRVDSARFPNELLAITTMEGVHIEAPQVLAIMPARTLGDLDDVAARISGLPVLVDQIISRLEEGRRLEITVPRVVAEQIPDSLATLIGSDPIDSPLLAAFPPPGSALGGADPGDVDDIRNEAIESFASATSALARLRRYLIETYVPACRTTTAFSALPDGAEWYADKVRAQTTTDLTPAEIHQTGLEEVARIRAEMEHVIDRTDFAQRHGNVEERDRQARFEAFAEFLRTDPRFAFDTAKGLLAAYRDMAKRADAEMPRLFGFLPRLPYGVRAVPDHEAPTAPVAFYVPGSLEIGRPGWFNANTYDLPSRPSYDMEATCLHEAVPGHHLQLAISAELEGLPKFRSKSWSYTAYVEGWGLYAESLGEEMGFYGDPYDKFGQLASELWRAIRLVVDTGLHALGWSREQAIDYCRTNSTAATHDIVTEIDRYLSIPGQALSYKIGELTITRLRRQATERLGASFDLRSFHDTVLGAGALPLAVLEDRVGAWERARSAGAAKGG